MEHTSPLIGNATIQKYLQKTVKYGTVTHVQLWLGPNHIGKSSFLVNYIFAIVCNEGCLKCRNCKLLLNNNYPNLIWLDAKNKEVKTDKILNLRNDSWYTTIYQGPKFLIIENIDQLNNTSSNALLKLLEEPADNLYIFLLSALPEKILATIKSRCLIINFNPVSNKEILNIWPDLPITTLAFAQNLPGQIIALKQNQEKNKIWQNNISIWLNILLAPSASKRLLVAQNWLKNDKLNETNILNIIATGSMVLHDILKIKNNTSNLTLQPYIGDLKKIAQQLSTVQTYKLLKRLQIIWQEIQIIPLQKKLILANILLTI